MVVPNLKDWFDWMREFILILWYMTVSVSYSHLLLTSTPAFSRLTLWASDTTSCLPYPLKSIVLSYVTCPQLSIPSYLQDLLMFFPPYFHYHLRQEYRGLITLSPVSYCQPSNCLTNFYHLNIHLVSSTLVISCLHFCRRLSSQFQSWHQICCIVIW